MQPTHAIKQVTQQSELAEGTRPCSTRAVWLMPLHVSFTYTRTHNYRLCSGPLLSSTIPWTGRASRKPCHWQITSVLQELAPQMHSGALGILANEGPTSSWLTEDGNVHPSSSWGKNLSLWSFPCLSLPQPQSFWTALLPSASRWQDSLVTPGLCRGAFSWGCSHLLCAGPWPPSQTGCRPWPAAGPRHPPRCLCTRSQGMNCEAGAWEPGAELVSAEEMEICGYGEPAAVPAGSAPSPAPSHLERLQDM